MERVDAMEFCRDKVAALLSSQGQVTELVSELQSLKTELLRSKEVSRINSEGVRNELKAAQDHVKALEASLNDLKEKLGFEGYVMSDWGATHSTSIGQGLDVEMPGAAFMNARHLKVPRTDATTPAHLDPVLTSPRHRPLPG